MASGDRHLEVSIVAFSGAVWSGTGVYVSAPTMAGPIGIYPRHQPVLALLQDGEVKVQLDGGGHIKVHVTGGFLSIDQDLVTVIADHGERVD